MQIREALPAQADTLTQLIFASKRYWGYADEDMARWASGLTISSAYIEKNMTALAEENGEILGIVSLLEEPPEKVFCIEEHRVTGGFFLDFLFVRPDYIRRGIGRQLASHALDWCGQKNIDKLYVISDPNAKGFYERLGAVCLGSLTDPPNSGTGRVRPFLVFRLNGG